MSITYILHAIMYFLYYAIIDIISSEMLCHILASHCLQVLSSQTRKQPYKTHEKFMSVKIKLAKNKKIVNVTKGKVRTF